MSIPYRLTAERVRELLDYNPETGEFSWKEEKRAGFKGSVVMHKKGSKAGTKRTDGRTVIRVDARLYMAYRLAWLWMTGEWPRFEIDHIDGDSTNDRFANLRDVSRKLNQENLRRPQKSKGGSKYLGVYANKFGRRKPWRAAISTNGKQKYLGEFLTEEEAYQAYLLAKRQLHEGCTL
ncbi:HNH endonuclease signature motif containing protein [Pseudomonas luteola]|uniref:HNH endonuclease signature motif containing protein n=1 Tax=Pseudomonas luteola TaxID=47886 RepID=UPI003A8B5F01